ncbi:hypothetical protein DL95DRAFT_447441 [Leptodontidium sp. 2 PMI_412]|nr:hypothetical protein DL95DRAFT_447441 [Leptodontidium sp. 2 PMI_412]
MVASRPNLELISQLTIRDGKVMDTTALQAILFDDWSEILRAAPLALSCLGECYVAASVPKSALIELEVPSSPYKHVRSNLVHCADLGRDAFQEAQSQMNKVQLATRFICQPQGLIEKILKGVENERLATTLVPKLLKQLEQMAKRCEDGTEVMDKKFKAWLENSQDILKACLNSKDNTTNALDENKSNLYDAIATKNSLVTETKKLEKAESKAQADLDKATAEMWKAYKSAKPSIKNSLVDLGEGTIRLTKHAINKTLDIAEEVAKNGFYQDFGIPRLVTREQQQQQASPASGPHQPQNFQVGGDIASFVLNTEVENQFSVLCGIVAQDGGMEDLLVNYRPAQSQLIEGVLRGLEVQLSQVPLAQSADSEVVAVREALASAVSITKEIQLAAEGMKKENKPKPEPQVSAGWKQNLGAALQNYGSHASQIRTRRQQSAVSSMGAQSGGEGISIAKQRMQRVEVSTRIKDMMQESYRLAQEKREKAKLDLLKAELRAKRLNDENLTLGEIIAILKDCLAALADLKKQIQKLSSFFTELHNVVKSLSEDKMAVFIMEVEAESPLEDIKYASHVLRINYAVTFELASMYVDVSKSQIMPGLDLLGTLSLMEHKSAGQKTLMGNYVQKALVDINGIADKRRNELRQALRIDIRGEAEEVF